MSHTDFVHLTVRTAYSLAEGAIKVKELVGLCQSAKMPAVAVTDSGNLFGALEFAVTASKGGVQPIIGVTVNLRHEEVDDARRLRVVGGTSHVALAPDHLVLIAQTDAGYRNLLDLVSQAFLEGDGSETPQITMADLEGKTDGVIALTGGVHGAVGRLLLEDRKVEAEEMLGVLHRLFEDRLYIELQRHFLESERRIEPELVDLAYRHDIPLVATNDCHFAGEDMYEAHDVLLCIAESTTISDPKRRQVTPHHRFKSAAEMRELFVDLPEAVNNTMVIAERCGFMPTTLDPILPAYDTGEGRDEGDELRVLAEAGLELRLERHVFTAEMDAGAREAAATPYRARLEMELGVINQMGFPGYFLIVADFIQWAKAQDIPVGPGRGSGAGSVVAWVLLITDLDPLRWGLLFERFLNPERVSMPDFDIDFCQDRRGEVIEYVQRKYGRDRVAQIITFGKLQARAVLRDVGRVLEMPYGQVDRICKMVPNNPANPSTLGEAIESEKELRRQRDEDESVRTLLGIGLKLEGLYRNASTHAAGVVIGDRPLKELVPLYRDPRSDMPATQFNMKWVESAGLVKFDFLGLKTLSVLKKAVELVAERGVTVDLQSVPIDDAPTYEMIGRADSTGVFQLESSGMRDVLRRMRPDRFEDIIALVALYRPGPMANIPSYISRKHGEEPVDYMHPKLEPVLKETFGIMIYQEQVQQAAQVLAGYTLGGADLLRRAMGKKIQAEMDAQRETFVDGSVANGVDREKASSIFDTIAAFAGYGFNKSHAAAYALVAYHTAYMKANYPVEFLAASMCYDMGNTDKLNIFRTELQAQSIQLLPPDINKSGRDFLVEALPDGTLAIRYALAAIKNVGAAAMVALESERDENGPYTSLGDFATRIDGRSVNKRSLENLVRAGAMDGLHDNRAQLMDGADMVLRHATAAAEERSSDQTNLFGGAGEVQEVKVALPARHDWSALDRLQHEFEAIGFYLSSHPLDAYGPALERVGVVESSGIAATVAAKSGSGRLNVAGIVGASRVRTNQRGNKYAFVQMSDRSGVFEVTIFSEVLAEARELLNSTQPLLVRVDAKLEEGSVRLIASRIQLLDEAMQSAAKGLKVYLKDIETVEKLQTILSTHARGRGAVKVVVQSAEREVDLALPDAYRIDARIRSAVKSLPGIVDVRDI
ncbi:MAG: DNA polymerase III subunit alpha [Proteobacteria bacterium]|nr:DNA polymerase III subunit alpha [Pseudomonadota bacterium]